MENKIKGFFKKLKNDNKVTVLSDIKLKIYFTVAIIISFFIPLRWKLAFIFAFIFIVKLFIDSIVNIIVCFLTKDLKAFRDQEKPFLSIPWGRWKCIVLILLILLGIINIVADVTINGFETLFTNIAAVPFMVFLTYAVSVTETEVRAEINGREEVPGIGWRDKNGNYYSSPYGAPIDPVVTALKEQKK